MNIDQALTLLKKKGGSLKPLFPAIDLLNFPTLNCPASDIYRAGAMCGVCGACGACGACGPRGPRRR